MITRYGAWLLAAVLVAPVAARANDEHEHQGRRDDRQEVSAPPQVRSFNVGATGSLKLANVAGDVKVTGGAGSEIRI